MMNVSKPSLVLAFAVLVMGSLAQADVPPPAPDYFSGFVYKIERHDDGDGEVQIWHRYLSGETEINPTQDRRIAIEVVLALLENGTAEMFYSERAYRRAAPGSETWYLEGGFPCERTRRVLWKVEGGVLKLGDVAIGKQGFYHGQNGVTITLLRAIQGPEMVGLDLALGYTFANTSYLPRMPQGPFCGP